MAYNIDIKTFEDLESRLNVPSFQRALVWSNSQKKDFIDTLIGGYPFGSILLYEYEDKNKNKYSLIDGLQRYTTMVSFKENPLEYIDFETYVDRMLEIYPYDLSSSEKVEISNIIRNTIITLIENEISGKGNDVYELYDQIVAELPGYDGLKEVEREIVKLQKDIIYFFKNTLDISQVQIPCIIFEGEESDLAEVFQRLNRGGKKLSKYQVFAAHWDKYNLKLNEDFFSRDLLNKIIERYNKLNEDRGLEIENFDPLDMKENKVINLAEFCYGLGYLIAEKISVFYKRDSINEDICNELGYQTLAIVLNIKTTELHKISAFHKQLDNSSQIELLLKNIIEVYKLINNTFGKRFKVPTYRRDGKYETKSFTRLQILSIFGAYWKAGYDVSLDLKINVKPKKDKKKNQGIISKNIMPHALYDIIRKYWSGTGDTKLIEIYMNDDNKYMKPLSKDYLLNELLRWNDESVNKSSINIQADEKLILAYIANLDKQFYSEINDDFDYEHIFPRKLINEHKNNAIIPGGALGNIMLLDEKTNRMKKEKTLYDVQSLDQVDSAVNLLDYYTDLSKYPAEDEINKVNKDIQLKKYDSLIRMIKERGTVLINYLVNRTYQ